MNVAGKFEPVVGGIDQDGLVVGKISGPAPGDLLLATVQRLVLGESIGTITTGEVENRQ